jgi:hypothetical protein
MVINPERRAKGFYDDHSALQLQGQGAPLANHLVARLYRLAPEAHLTLVRLPAFRKFFPGRLK